ncbi:MAG TPA: ABC transporter ATP-binding protein [Actinomycetota bacterium]|jgi:branched-chain amino acid transport system ATP-binding protein|nr:ABC transporter ATP-binding protein [Actinomycetota bacterium]
MLEVQNLSAGYATGTVLRGVSLGVAEGEVLALLGRNGMGKTTLLRAIAGLRPPGLTQGSVRVEGEEVSTLPSYRVARRGVSLVPQGRRVFGSLTVEENLQIVARPNGAWDLGRVYDLFPRLVERRRQAGSTLSGGEQQMLAIGRSLMTNPRLLLMDEPSEGLAPAVLDLILDRLRQLKQHGQAVLLAEQNVDLALAVADRVCVLGEAGRIAWSGRPATLRDDPAVLRELVGL